MNNAVLEALKKPDVTRALLVSVIAGVFLAIIAPLGSNYLSVVPRFAYWITLCIAGYLGGLIGDFLSRSYFARTGTIGRILITALLASAAVLVVLFSLFRHLPITFGLATYVNVFVISLGITGITEGFSTKAIPTETNDIQQPTLIDRLPIELRDAEIYAISAEDHYVKIHTSKGHTMILMRFKDAVRDISPLPGMISHRSWWVAEQGVKSIKKQSRSAVLTLKNDEVAQVSRNGLKELRELGWVD